MVLGKAPPPRGQHPNTGSFQRVPHLSRAPLSRARPTTSPPPGTTCLRLCTRQPSMASRLGRQGLESGLRYRSGADPSRTGTPADISCQPARPGRENRRPAQELQSTQTLPPLTHPHHGHNPSRPRPTQHKTPTPIRKLHSLPSTKPCIPSVACR